MPENYVKGLAFGVMEIERGYDSDGLDSVVEWQLKCDVV